MKAPRLLGGLQILVATELIRLTNPLAVIPSAAGSHFTCNEV